MFKQTMMAAVAGAILGLQAYVLFGQQAAGGDAAAAKPADVKPPEMKPAEGTPAAKVTQYGITWTFDKEYPTGRYVTGDWWVVGPVTVTGVDPVWAGGKNGSEVNPPAGTKQGYDSRIPGYNASLQAVFPLALKPGESLVSTSSVEKVGDRTPDTVPGQYARGPLRTAAVLTCVEKVPPADAFRPAYVGDKKLSFTTQQLRRDLLPRLAVAGKLPNRAHYERMLQRIWLDHLADWVGREMHPLENMPDYGREITSITSTVGLMLLTADPKEENETLLRRYVQLGIDNWGMVQSNPNLWPANGGHDSGRKWPIIFAGLMLGNEDMQHVKATFAEDEQTYFGQGYRGQKVLWMINKAVQHEELSPDHWKDPKFKGDNDGWKSEAYRSLNGPTWIGSALAARLMGAKKVWDHDAFFDYVDRWVAEAKDGAVDQKTMKPAGYKPFPADGFTQAMWEAYREKADAIGAESEKKR